MDFDYQSMTNIDAMELESVAACSGWYEVDDCGPDNDCDCPSDCSRDNK